MHEAVSYIVIVVDLPKGTGRQKLTKPHFLQTSKMLIFDRKTDGLQFLSSLKNDEVKSKFGKKTKHQQVVVGEVPFSWAYKTKFSSSLPFSHQATLVDQIKVLKTTVN